MTLRTKLLLAQAPLALALAFVGVLSVATVSYLGGRSEAILRDNYRSVLAAQRMKESIERMQDEAVLALIDGRTAAPAAPVADYRQRFEEELRVQEGNITEPGETEATAHLRVLWDQYQRRFDGLRATSDAGETRRVLFDELDPAFAAVRGAADNILALNQDAIVRRSEAARRAAARMDTTAVIAALAALLVGMVASASTTSRLLQPLAHLTKTVQQIGNGDFSARAIVPGHDEIAQFAANVNSMAERLNQYRRSSLGELLLAQQASQAAIDSIPDPVVVFDVNGDILTVNRPAETVLGLTLSANRPHSKNSIDPALRAVIDRVRSHVLSGKGAYLPRGFEEAVRVTAAEGDRYVLPRATPVYADEGGITGATVILQDVTRLRRFDELKNDLVATVAHEFRTPLTSLRMAIHLCLEELAGPLTSKQADLLYAGREDCERLQVIVDELLDLARIQGGRMDLHRRPTGLAELVAAVVDAQRHAAAERQIEISGTVLPGLGEVLVDRERIQLVLSNLLTNALRHTPAGGTVRVGTHPTDHAVRVEVSDTGPGIAPEYQERIFDKFFRVPGAASGGAGLGLSISKEVIEAHGGSIGVDSIVGRGATFWFTLPLAKQDHDGGVS